MHYCDAHPPHILPHANRELHSQSPRRIGAIPRLSGRKDARLAHESRPAYRFESTFDTPLDIRLPPHCTEHPGIYDGLLPRRAVQVRPRETVEAFQRSVEGAAQQLVRILEDRNRQHIRSHGEIAGVIGVAFAGL